MIRNERINFHCCASQIILCLCSKYPRAKWNVRTSSSSSPSSSQHRVKVPVSHASADKASSEMATVHPGTCILEPKMAQTASRTTSVCRAYVTVSLIKQNDFVVIILTRDLFVKNHVIVKVIICRIIKVTTQTVDSCMSPTWTPSLLYIRHSI